MDFEQVIRTRRSVRKYKTDTVPREIIKNILSDSVSFAPSAKNLQPYKFLVYKDIKERQQIVSLCKANVFMANAPYIIVGLANQETCYPTNAGYMATDLIDFSIVFYQILLSANNEGLATCWIGAFEGEKMEKHLGIKPPWRIVALTPIGYADESPIIKPRKAPSEVIEWK
ncbi:MAG: nitroreductase family protein [Deltaproteobacteria bacterium]|nr:nitroreductase family protein [Deltaproteobacteria bacterium]